MRRPKPASETPPTRLVVAMDGVRILGTAGTDHEFTVGLVTPIHGTVAGGAFGYGEDSPN